MFERTEYNLYQLLHSKSIVKRHRSMKRYVGLMIYNWQKDWELKTIRSNICNFWLPLYYRFAICSSIPLFPLSLKTKQSRVRYPKYELI